jgi:hypothetical protein
LFDGGGDTAKRRREFQMFLYQSNEWSGCRRVLAPKPGENPIFKRVVVKIGEVEAVLHDSLHNVPVGPAAPFHHDDLTVQGREKA